MQKREMQKRRRRIVVLLGAAAAAGCAAESAPEPGDKAGEREGSAREDLADHLRVARLSGRLAASLALYRAGAAEMASDQLVRLARRPGADEREDLRAAGIEAAALAGAAEALYAPGRGAEESARLAAIEARLAEAADGAGGDPAETISFLMESLRSAYAEAVIDGLVVDGAKYQDAYGFALVARDRADGLAEPARGRTAAALDALIALWAEGPVPVSDPARAEAVAEGTAAVRAALAP